MAASLMSMLDDLEARLEHTQAELQALREENQRLKRQLAQQNAHEQSEPSPAPATAVETGAPSDATFDINTPAAKAPAESASAEAAIVETAPASTAIKEQTEVSATNEGAKGEGAKAPSPHALLNQWYERYPKAFFRGHTKPLKVGIHQDLVEREEWSGKLIRRALANYVNLPRYIKAVREGAERVDLVSAAFELLLQI